MSTPKPVYISIPGIYDVLPARWYQVSAYNTFVNDKEEPTSKEFKYCKINDNDKDIVFKLAKFDNSGMSGVYPSFCTLTNEHGECHVLSNDKEALSSFHGYRTRLTMW
jgi:hypothetical protein